MNRRYFLGFCAAAVSGYALFGRDMVSVSQASTDQASPDKVSRLFSAANDDEGKHYIYQLSSESGDVKRWGIPFRAHDVLPDEKNKRVIAFGRRPDTQCAVANFGSEEVQLFEAEAGRHFYGHGVFSPAGDTLFTTENDYEQARGTIGIRDAKTYEVIGEYETYGIGPHDIHLMPDQKTFVIANGGIQTHPDYGRRKLNLDSMQPSLVYVDVASGKKVDEYRLNDSLLSIRHLTVTEKGDVGVATQYQGKLYKRQPEVLAAWQKSGEELQALNVSEQSIKPLRGYMADLAFDTANNVLAVTAPRGNQVTFWNVNSREFINALEVPEPSGIVYQPDKGVFLVSSAKGGVFEVTTSRKDNLANPIYQSMNTLWDNHMVLVS